MVSGCGRQQVEAVQEAPQPIAVEVQEVTLGGERLFSEYPGRVTPVRVADIRSRVTGIVLKRHFTEGAEVKEGDILFTIDPAPFAAAVERAKGDLARSEAQLEQARILLARYERLAGAEAISRQDFEDAATAKAVAEAAARIARAAEVSAQLDLEYSTVRSPISGRIGSSYISEGTLVVANDASVMARVQQLDPVYVDAHQSAEDFTRLRELLKAGALSHEGASASQVTVLVGGSAREMSGTILFSDVSVSPSTGQITVRAEIPNSDHLLLPGMYVRLKIADGVDKKSFFVPQRAVLRDQTGNAKLMVVAANGTAEERPVTTGLLKGAVWQITSGLTAGDRVIINGADKIAQSTRIDPRPIKAAPQQ